MLRIYKYPIPIEDDFALSLPDGAQVLDVQTQYGQPQLWALVDPEAPMRERQFILRGTGHDIHYPLSALIHCGTFQEHGGSVVFHVLEVVT